MQETSSANHSKNKSAVIWLTGLSGAGKTTISNDLIRRFKNDGINPIYLDGDEIRNIIPNIGFDEESRKKHNLMIGLLSAMFEKQGNTVIVSLISPYNDIREQIRKACKNFIEVYVSTDFETCKSRDPKGLYRKAISGEIKNFTGLTAPYDVPLSPEIIIDTLKSDIKSSSKIIYEFYGKS
ncbi:adenylyl-sulfate kinase [Chryseobacterium sp. FH1]|uniref:adenylyl-sulfate kinase n=1 Tax=Chryseobacterium sp. FH1 TaxID=1233951 RepID=UPI00068DDDB1|nr:adenylyl-sulfate kinase [Chryseobacterium sp. FH1]